MATIKVTNEEGNIAEFKYEVPSLDNEQEVLSNNNSRVRIDKSGLITEEIWVKSIIGSQIISFPLEFKSHLTGIFIGRCIEELKPYIRLSIINKKEFRIEILSHPYSFDEDIVISAVGY